MGQTTVTPRVRGADDEIPGMLGGRPVLVTGAAGFVGSHLVEQLLDYGARVHVFVRATSSGMLHNLAAVQTRITIHRGDLTDKQAVSLALKALRSDGGQSVIFHLGAQAHVGESWARPYETLATNFLGTLNLLQSIVDTGLDVYRVDTAGSSEEYGNLLPEVKDHYRFEGASLLLDERAPLNPQSPYATAKVAADFVTRNFHAAYGIPTVVTRMFNNYGPRQNPRFVTGTIITQALTRPEIELGALEPLRDFCFTTDGVRGHLTVAARGVAGDVYVYGQGENISMADWCDLILRTGAEHGFWP